MKEQEIDFPVSADYSKETIQRVQQELLAMAKQVCNILENHNIPHFMAFGTLMGAMKYEGFLPWDDDIDLFLFDDTYEQAIRFLQEELAPNLIVHGEMNDPKYFLAWNSVKNLSVEVQDYGFYNPDNRLLRYRCLGLDLYRLCRINSDEVHVFKAIEALKFFQRKYNAGIISQEEFSGQEEKIQNTLKKAPPRKNDTNEKVYDFVVKLKRPLLPSEIFPLRKYKFEDCDLLGPNNILAVLQASFDDVHTLPVYEDRKPHLKTVTFIE